MSKVITFSEKFPSYHPKAGEPTFFVEKFWASIKVPLPVSVHAEQLEARVRNLMLGNFTPKHHTIRMGNRWNVGDKFSPRIWSGKPYNSKQIIISDDQEILKIWNIESSGNNHIYINDKSINVFDVDRLAYNDGLTTSELMAWFKYPAPFKGQILCWNNFINY